MVISQTLAFIGLVLIIFLVITVFKISATISELRGKVLSLEETLDYKDRDLRHKGRFIAEMQNKIQRLEKYHVMYQAPTPENKAYTSVRLIHEIEKGRSIEADKFFISQELRRAAEPYIEWTEGAGGGLRGILTVYYSIDNG